MFGRDKGTGERDKAKQRMRRNIAKATKGEPAGSKGARAETSVVGGTVDAQHAEAPMNEFMVRLLAQELPVLDSVSRRIINQELREHKEAGKPQITCVAELPETVQEILGF
ncbi:MAG: hypothetical protein L0K02_04305 [Corynebacterium sp.]|nr:hypothetical protein [Corynebacterium sp.]